MRNLFSINIENQTENPGDNEHSSPFILREIYKSLTKGQSKIADKMELLEKKWALPTWLSYARVVALGIGAMLLACAVMVLIGVGFAYAFSSPWFIVAFVAGVLLCAFGTVCYVVEYKRRKKVEASDEYKRAMDEIDRMAKRSENYLNLPNEKTKVDILFYTYIVRDNKMRDNSAFKYLNMSFYLFEEENKLCLANSNAVYGIDKTAFKRIVSDPKKTSFTLWNKDESHISEEYKQYKITLDHYGVYHVRGTCSVQFETQQGQAREIVIPPYELPHFEKILNLKPIDNEDDETVK
ncbi:MAG: hypothetical protein J6B45_05260 [Clostridia bacterium]|nr:hypothetical protein [Clostridia bacterium]